VQSLTTFTEPYRQLLPELLPCGYNKLKNTTTLRSQVTPNSLVLTYNFTSYSNAHHNKLSSRLHQTLSQLTSPLHEILHPKHGWSAKQRSYATPSFVTPSQTHTTQQPITLSSAILYCTDCCQVPLFTGLYVYAKRNTKPTSQFCNHDVTIMIASPS